MSDWSEIIAGIEALQRKRSEDTLSDFDPYPFQKAFCCPVDDKGVRAKQVALVAANKSGKTYGAARCLAIHATGLYPDWWTGEKFKKAPILWVSGDTIGNTRDICQAELLGEPGNTDDFGHGAIPKALIGRTTKYQGIPDAIQTVLVKHTSGKWAKIIFKAFEQGKKAFMGKAVHYSWLDEEVPYDIYSQCIRASLQFGGIIGMSFTPESGLTPLVDRFMNHRSRKQAYINATWDDAPHLDIETREQLLEGLLPHEREMRSKGVPVMGTGLIWPVAESKIMCDPFTIPDDWKRIAGIDFAGSGSDGHPTALVSFAIDPETGTTYIYDTYREPGKTIPEHWLAMKRVGTTPVAWPHDGMIKDRGSQISYAEQYRDAGANMLRDKFSNPPMAGNKEGSGGNGVKAGLTAIYSSMMEGRFKVFSNQVFWFEEFRSYYQKDGEIVKKGDDLMSATRYGFMSQRFALNITRTYKGYIPESDYYSDSIIGY